MTPTHAYYQLDYLVNLSAMATQIMLESGWVADQPPWWGVLTPPVQR